MFTVLMKEHGGTWEPVEDFGDYMDARAFAEQVQDGFEGQVKIADDEDEEADYEDEEADYDEDDDGQPDEAKEWADYMGGDNGDFGQFDNEIDY